MGRTKQSCGSVNDTRPRSGTRSKKRDSNGSTTISDAVLKKYAWILQNKPIVLCKKLPHNKLPTVSEASSSVSHEILKLPQERSKRTKDSILCSLRDTFCKTESKIQESKKTLTSKVVFKTSSSQLSRKRTKLNNSKSHVGTPASTSRCKDYLTPNLNKINGNESRSCAALPSEAGSSEEEFSKIRTSLKIIAGRNGVQVHKCTRDPNRLTPCSEECCIQFSKGHESRRKKSKNKNKLIQRTVDTSPAQKRTKDRKPRTKGKETSEEQISTKEERTEVIKHPLKIAILTPKQERPTISQCNPSSTTKLKRYLLKSQHEVITANKFSEIANRPGLNNFANSNNPGSSKNKTCQEKVNTASTKKNLKINFSANSSSTKQNLRLDQKLCNRMKPSEYVVSTFKSETKTSHPKASEDRRAQNQMLEAATFPNTNVTSGSNNQESRNQLKRLYNSDGSSFRSPLSYQEHEYFESASNYSKQENVQKIRGNDDFPHSNIKIGVNDLNCSNLSNEIGTQSVNNQENGNFLLKNSIDTKFSTCRKLTNSFEYYEKDRFRQSTVERIHGNSDNSAKINLDEAVSKVEAEDVAPTPNNDLFLDKEVTLLGNQLPYPDHQQNLSLQAPLENPAKESNLVFENEFSFDSTPMSELNGVMELLEKHSSIFNMTDSAQLSPSISTQKKNIKIMKTETIPLNCIQILPRLKTLDKNRTQSQEAPGMNGQYNENSVCEQEKVAIIKIQNLEQLRKDEFLQSQVTSYDYHMIGEDLMNNFSLPTTQEENALLNSSILDSNYDLGNLSCDGFLEDDSNGQIDICNTVVVKESVHCTESPDLSEMIQLFDENGHPSIVAANLENIPTFGEFTTENNCMGNGKEATACTASNFEKINSVTGTPELNEYSNNFKEPDLKSLNAVNEGVQFQVVSNHRKRRWFDEKQKSVTQPDKKVKLNRKWNQSLHDGEDYTDTSSEISSSCKSSLYDADHNMVQVNVETSDANHSLVQNTVKTKNSTSLSFTHLKEMAERSDVKIYEPKVESNFQVEIKKFARKTTLKTESQVDSDPEPEPERGDSDSQQPAEIKKAKFSPVRRKKKRNGHRYKFSPSCYSNSSTSSSDDELTKNGSFSSDDEYKIKGKHSLLNLRLERELTNLQDQENSNLSQKIVPPFQDMGLQDNPEDDILSVIASPSLMNITISSRCTTPVTLPKAVQSEYSDTDDCYWDTFKRKNMDECCYDLRSFVENKQAEKEHIEKETRNQAGTSAQLDKAGSLFAKPFAPLSNVKTPFEYTVNSNDNIATDDQRPLRAIVSRVFLGVCHCFLVYGRCTRKSCNYDHKIPIRLQVFQNQTEEQVFSTVCDGINTRFTFYVQSVYKLALKRLNYNFALKLYINMYTSDLLNQTLLSDTVEVLWQKEGPLLKVIKDMADPLEAQSQMAKRLLILAHSRSSADKVWETLRPLIWKAEFLPYIIQTILKQCINEKENKSRIKEVYEFIMATGSFRMISPEMWISFYNLVIEQSEKKREKQVENLDTGFDNSHFIANQCIASPDGINHRPDQINYEIPGDDSPQSPIDMEICNTPNSVDTSYRLLPIDDLPPVQLWHKDDDRFWKFYDQFASLKNGLKHGDYKHIVNIMKQYPNPDRTLFSRHCHRALVEEIKKAEIHLDNIIRIAVQTGELCKLREILSHLGTNVLIRLADQGLWVHAYELLKTLQTYHLHNKNAGFILLAAEICLANHRFMKALTLLKQSDIIFTNCQKWKVSSNNGDFELRTSVVTLLLESLCQESAEKAFFIFDLILGEQPSNYFPVDLTRIVDKLILSLLAQNHIDIVMSLCKKAMRYHLNFHETTYRVVLTALVPNDINLARQFYQYATYLGAYITAKVYPVTHMIVNVDWSKQEMYIIVLEFLRKLFLDIGFAVSHLRPNQLAVFFLFELVPTSKQLYNEHSDSKRRDSMKINKSKSMMKTILKTRFDPPIKIVKKEQGKICKINSRTLVDYLKAGHF